MRSKRFIKSANKEYLMDLTPLIDVVFLLLIFFMVATTFNEFSSMNLALPQTKKMSEISTEISFTRVIVNKKKQISIVVKRQEEKKFEVKEADLAKKLKEILSLSNEKNVSLIADKYLDYGYIVELIGLIKEAGASGLNIESEIISD